LTERSSQAWGKAAYVPYPKTKFAFEALTEHELLSRATRELLIAQIVVSQELCLHAPILVAEKKPGETATLLRALAKAMSAAANSFGQIGGFRTGCRDERISAPHEDGARLTSIVTG
jgi:hypothetical protein